MRTMKRLLPLLAAFSVTAAEPPAPSNTNGPVVHMLIPGFTVRELPIKLTSLNNIEYGPDGRLFAAGYDGRFHLLRDTDSDGLEDKVISCIGSFTDIKGGHVFPQLIKDTAKKPIRVFIEDTRGDLPNPTNPKRDWHLQNIAMVEALKEKGYDFTHVFADGNHSDAHGGSIMPDMMRWIWRDAAK